MTETKFHPRIGGSMTVYQEIAELNPRVGDLVRVRFNENIAPIIVTLTDASYYTASIEGVRFYLGDVANGHPGNTWVLEFERRELSAVETFKGYPIGQQFKSSNNRWTTYIKTGRDNFASVGGSSMFNSNWDLDSNPTLTKIEESA